MNLDNYNYYRDPRTKAMYAKKWYTSIDKQSMKATVRIEGKEVEVYFQYEVCNLCRGKGTVVNPSIDCNGLTSEDFDRDPDFYAEYMSGLYDITCPECNGRNVTPKIDRYKTDKFILLKVDKEIEEQAAYEAECAMERALGC